MTASSIDPDYLSDADEQLRQLLARLMSPSDMARMTDAEIEALCQAPSDFTLSEEQMESISRKVEKNVQAAKESPSRAGRSVPLGPVSLSAINESSAPPSSPVLGFLGNLTHLGGSFTPTLWTLLVLVSGMLLTLSLVVLAIRGIHVHSDGPEVAQQKEAGKTDMATSNPQALASVPKSTAADPEWIEAPPAKVQRFAPNQVAMLTRVYKARWSGTSKDIAPGDQFATGRELHLDDGLAELRFRLGARVIIEGPVRMKLRSFDAIDVFDGKISVRADSEDARGFIVRSRVARMVDLGTEFGAAIDKDRETDLHVFQGLVEVTRNSDKADQAMRLSAGQRIVMRREGALEVPSQGADPGRFVRDLATVEYNHNRWLRWSKSVRKAPDLIGYYTFEAKSDEDQVLGNIALSGAATAGAIRGPRWGEGRWPGKSALCFSSSRDCVRLDVPGSFPALTLAAWVRLKGLENDFSSLLMTDGWKERVGQCHWQLTRSGRMDLGVGVHLGPNSESIVYRSLPLPETDDFGRWLHLAVVYDTAAGQVSFYADGRPVSVKPIPVNIPLALGPCEIGNWVPFKGTTLAQRSFQGQMDELMIFRRALSSAEVKNIYEEGKP